MFIIFIAGTLFYQSGVDSQYTVATPSRFSETAKPLPAHPNLPKVEIPESYDGCDDCSKLSRLIAWSLDHEPDKWDTDSYRIAKNSVIIWIANGAEDLKLCVTATGACDGESHPWGQDDTISNEKKLIWRAYTRWLKPREAKVEENAEKAFQ